MTNEDAIAIIRKEYLCVDRDCDIERSCGKCDLMMPSKEPILEAYNMAIKALEQDPKWIPVSEKLPYNHEYRENNGLFNVSDGNRTYSEWFDIYDTQKFGEPTMYGFRVDHAVIAWMPLPKPYEPQESEE